MQQARAQAADMKARIEYDVRAAFLDLHAADERVHVAQVAADLADQQLTQTQDRFSPPASPATWKSCRRRKPSPPRPTT